MSDSGDREAQLIALAVRKGWLTPAQVEDARRIKQHLAAEGIRDSLLDILRRKGQLSDAHGRALRKEAGLPTVQLGEYEILGRIGRGGMGTVYKAVRSSTGQTVALKTIHLATAPDATTVARLQREARAAAAMDHPNIVRALDAGEVNGTYYFSMEFVEGESLASVLRRVGKVSEAHVVELALAVGSALQHIHQRGMIHRDVKPSNILITSSGAVKLCDLGLARATEGDAMLTQAGIVIGSPAYMSPEQTEGRPDLDGRTDLYSLGATMVHALTGALPTERMHRQTLEGVSPSMNAILQKLTAPNATTRYPSAERLLHDLHRLKRGEPIQAVDFEYTPTGDHRVVRLRPARRRVAPSRSSGVLVGLGAAAAAAIALVIFFSQPQPSRPREPSRKTSSTEAATQASEPVALSRRDPEPRKPEKVHQPMETPPAVETKAVSRPDPAAEESQTPREVPPAESIAAIEKETPVEAPREIAKEAAVEKREAESKEAAARAMAARAQESWTRAEKALKDKRYPEARELYREFNDQFVGTAMHESVKNQIAGKIEQAEKGLRQQREREIEKRYNEAVRSNTDPLEGIKVLEGLRTQAADTQFVQRGQKRIDAALARLYMKAMTTGTVGLKADVNATIQAGADSSLIVTNTVQVPASDLVPLLANGELTQEALLKIFRPLLQGADYQRGSLRGVRKGNIVDLTGQVAFKGIANKAGDFSVTVSLQGRIELRDGKMAAFTLQSTGSQMSTFIGRPGSATISVTLE